MPENSNINRDVWGWDSLAGEFITKDERIKTLEAYAELLELLYADLEAEYELLRSKI